MKILTMLALLTTSLAAGELFEVVAASNEKVEGTREVVYEKGEQKMTLFLHSPSLITSVDVAAVSLTKDDAATVEVKLTEAGSEKFEKKTKGMDGKRIALFVQEKIVSAPILTKGPLGGVFYVKLKDEAEAKGFVEAFGKLKK